MEPRRAGEGRSGHRGQLSVRSITHLWALPCGEESRFQPTASVPAGWVCISPPSTSNLAGVGGVWVLLLPASTSVRGRPPHPCLRLDPAPVGPQSPAAPRPRGRHWSPDVSLPPCSRAPSPLFADVGSVPGKLLWSLGHATRASPPARSAPAFPAVAGSRTFLVTARDLCHEAASPEVPRAWLVVLARVGQQRRCLYKRAQVRLLS